MTHGFDRLARTLAEAETAGLTRRRTLRLAAGAALAASPFAGFARAAGAGFDVGPDSIECRNCRDIVYDNRIQLQLFCIRRILKQYLTPNPIGKIGPAPIIHGLRFVVCGHTAIYRHFEQRAIYCGPPCGKGSLPTPGNLTPPATPPPATPPSDPCLNCQAVGGKCCPPSGPLCACANPDLPCSRYNC